MAPRGYDTYYSILPSTGLCTTVILVQSSLFHGAEQAYLLPCLRAEQLDSQAASATAVRRRKSGSAARLDLVMGILITKSGDENSHCVAFDHNLLVTTIHVTAEFAGIKIPRIYP